MDKFIFLEHTADVKFQAFGKTLEECFENAARAMFAVMHAGRIQGAVHKKKKIKVEGKDLLSLLYNFLEEFIFLMDTEDFFLKGVNVMVQESQENEKRYKLEADALGGKASEQEIAILVKAVTYHEMFVKKRRGAWVAQVVVDV